MYRVASRRYASNNSEGARLVGGRWNEVGTPVIYTSATKSLAALEIIVHHGMIPIDYRIINISIPDSLRIDVVDERSLPTDWREETRIPATARIGTEWAKALATAVLRVPAVVIAGEYNYVLNPHHPDFGQILFEVPDVDEIDQRLRKR